MELESKAAKKKRKLYVATFILIRQFMLLT